MKNDGECTLRPVSVDSIVSTRKRKRWKWAQSIRAFLCSGMEAAEVTGFDVPTAVAYSGLSQIAKCISGVRVMKRGEHIYLLRVNDARQAPEKQPLNCRHSFGPEVRENDR